MPAWFIAFCKSFDFVVYMSMLVPFYLAQRRRSYLTGGLVILQWVPAFLFTMYCLMHITNALWHNNLPLLHFNTIGETLLYLGVYHGEFINTKIKRTIRIMCLFFIIFAIIDSFFIEGFQQINSYTNLVESILIISLSLLFFEKTIIQRRKNNIHNIPMFIATVGIVIYLSGTILLYLTTNNLIFSSNENSVRLMYLISSVLLLLLSLLFSRAFLLAKPYRTQLSS